jgi:hypothetical protein
MNKWGVERPLFLIREGRNDCEFLFRLSQRLHAENPHFTDLTRLHADGRILLVPSGGGNFDQWAVRFAAIRCREFLLYDREIGPETLRRQKAIELVNSRPGCRGFLTSKRSLENYLASQAIPEAGGGPITVTDDECVGTELARHWYELIPQSRPWTELLRRSRERLIYRAKRWLNRQAVIQMTADLLAQRDPAGEVLQWLTLIADMATAKS